MKGHFTFYLETSVWNFLFAMDDRDKRKITETLFQEISMGNKEIFISEVVVAEVKKAPIFRYNQVMRAIDFYGPKFLEKTDEANRLTDNYLRAGILALKSREDLDHLAIASANRLDCLVTWNLKHIAKLKQK